MGIDFDDPGFKTQTPYLDAQLNGESWKLWEMHCCRGFCLGEHSKISEEAGASES